MAKSYQFEIAFCESILRRQPKDVTLMEMLAGYYTRAGRIEEGLELDRRIVEIDPKSAIGHYNLACSLSLSSNPEAAIASLRTALDLGYRDFHWLLQDPDLQNLHAEPAFADLLEDYQIHR